MWNFTLKTTHSQKGCSKTSLLRSFGFKLLGVITTT
uniref:Uncharacterized protein n=1 Tax=Rhizophora mucronata TaxID=61149 RepID=A0A2P2N143_RHIMU